MNPIFSNKIAPIAKKAWLNPAVSKSALKQAHQELAPHVCKHDMVLLSKAVRYVFFTHACKTMPVLDERTAREGVTADTLEVLPESIALDITKECDTVYKKIGVKYFYETSTGKLSFKAFCTLVKRYLMALLVHTFVTNLNAHFKQGVKITSPLIRLNDRYEACINGTALIAHIADNYRKYFNMPNRGELRCQLPYIKEYLLNAETNHHERFLHFVGQNTEFSFHKVYNEELSTKRWSYYDTNTTIKIGRDVVATHQLLGKVFFDDSMIGISDKSNVLRLDGGYIIDGVRYFAYGRGFEPKRERCIIYVADDGFCHRFKKERFDMPLSDLASIAQSCHQKHLSTFAH